MAKRKDQNQQMKDEAQAYLDALPDETFARTLVHPDRGPMTLDTLVQMYAWHGRHHLGHLQILAGSGA